jgi:hypothetical protein
MPDPEIDAEDGEVRETPPGPLLRTIYAVFTVHYLILF